MVFTSCNFDETKPTTFYCIDCSECDSLYSLLWDMYETLSFPDYFWCGNIWDSLNDCIYMQWVETQNIVIRFAGFGDLCKILDDEDQRDFIETIRFVAEHCHRSGPSIRAFRFIFE